MCLHETWLAGSISERFGEIFLDEWFLFVLIRIFQRIRVQSGVLHKHVCNGYSKGSWYLYNHHQCYFKVYYHIYHWINRLLKYNKGKQVHQRGRFSYSNFQQRNFGTFSLRQLRFYWWHNQSLCLAVTWFRNWHIHKQIWFVLKNVV